MRLLATLLLLVAAGAGPLPTPPAGPLPTPPAAPHAPVFGTPVFGPLQVTQDFAPPATRFGPGHRGVDLAAPAGSPVLSASAGVVTFAGQTAGVLTVAVTADDGVRTTYEPLALLAVRRGAAVSLGARLGVLAPGHPGCTAPAGLACLHWGALVGATYLDPLLLLSAPVGLLTPVPWPARPPR